MAYGLTNSHHVFRFQFQFWQLLTSIYDFFILPNIHVHWRMQNCGIHIHSSNIPSVTNGHKLSGNGQREFAHLIKIGQLRAQAFMKK